MTSIMTHCVVLLVICFFIVSVLSHSVWEPLLLDCCHLSFQSPNAYILSVCFCRLFFKRNCDFKFARIAQKSSEVKAVAYRRWILYFPQPSVHQCVKLKQSPKSNCLSKKKGNKNAQNSQSCIVKQSISRCKTDYLALQGWLSWAAKLTISGRKVDYLGSQDTQGGATGSQRRHPEMLISTIPVVKIFRIPARFFAASQQNADGQNTRRKMWHTYITGGFYNTPVFHCLSN